MFINKDSITINGVSVGQYLTEAKYGYNKLWASDSGRTLSGSMTGSLLGIFPKITLHFRKLNKSELEVVTPLLDTERQTVTYYDPTKQTTVTMTTYAGDYEINNKSIINDTHRNDEFSCSLISVYRRA